MREHRRLLIISAIIIFIIIAISFVETFVIDDTKNYTKEEESTIEMTGEEVVEDDSDSEIEENTIDEQTTQDNSVENYDNDYVYYTEPEPICYVNYGDSGRLYMPSIGLSVALYNSSEQWVCDNWDSACYFNYGSMIVYADHCNQEFAPLFNSYIGMEAYVEYADGSRTYMTCNYIADGYNGDWLMDTNGQRYGIDIKPSDILCYTCRSADPYYILCVGFNYK